MRRTANNISTLHRACAYTLAEVLVATLVVLLLVVSLYAALSVGFRLVESSRENLRATQIMVQRTEAVRLYTWSQLNNAAQYLSNSFTEIYDPYGVSSNAGGVKYYGKLTLGTNPDLPAAYQTNMRLLTIEIRWTNYNGKTPIPQFRQMQTHIAQYGMHDYIYGQ